MSQPLVFRWGIISTGMIANVFVKDLLVDPKTRDVHDVVHKVTAIGSRSVTKAQEFIDSVLESDKASAKAYGSYAEVYADKDVDVIYVATPHTYHYENAMDAIKAKKHVLCEKPVTVNAAELRSLLAAAKENNVFFMEAMWTRFHPLSLEFKEISESGVLGLPIAMHADLSVDFGIKDLPKTHRILDPMLGGGPLLDLGPYPLVWAIMALFEHPSNKYSQPSISGSMVMTPITGVDSNTSFTLSFSKADLSAQAVLSCSINAAGLEPGATIRYEKGVIKIAGPLYCPQSFTVQYFEKGKVVREETRNFEYAGRGMHFQADEVARCVRDGKIESEVWSHKKYLLEMDIFDEVRRQGGYVLPPGVEKVTA
ncbi:NAD(P)-binding protein [Dendrothele bispora CBS 962.96]|uniref:D-xylose 1-dehydrogenase (NADP(+), D-xylono-1,5-lactone-forming) n=1 Tax=Dendrothele bispora (strain CBS 962.96) TaxID=1314807 RepID=A0A4S8LBQ2_DENBC|nr:NAD(P)-binding protein [Dendrothele bispora CBS 962.96]